MSVEKGKEIEDWSNLVHNREAMYDTVLNMLREKQSFLVTGHRFVDGDCTGCEIALALGLRSLGKTVRVINNEKILDRYAFLDMDNICEVFDPETFPALLASSDAVVVVDNNSWDRLENLREPVQNSDKPAICIDHHRVQKPFSPFHLFDTRAAATGELVFDLLKSLGVTLTAEMAQAIYATICTDTGWFRHSNTTARSFEICAELVGLGVDPALVNASINYRESLGLKRLQAQVWDAVAIEDSGRVAIAQISQQMLRRHGAKMNETDGMVDAIRYLDGTRLVVMLKEMKDGSIRISMRSRSGYVAHDLATALGGGGHQHAAGAKLLGMSLTQAGIKVRQALAECLENWKT